MNQFELITVEEIVSEPSRMKLETRINDSPLMFR